MNNVDAATIARTVHRADYAPPPFLIDAVDLAIALDPTATIVTSRLAIRRNAPGPLHLDGDGPTLVSIAVDGVAVPPEAYRLDARGLTMLAPPDAGTLEIVVRIDPTANTELSGLYRSGGAYFTQCEAEGFRRITFFPDRPDVMSRYRVTVTGDASTPVLLSNGNPGEQGTTADGRPFARWDDPHPKPSYLFALVAGELVAVRDRFTTRSGRDVALAIWVRAGDEDRCGWAMESLKNSMAWDERVYGFEYDLDVFNIAAVSDFNMGAMENKGLNVFNTRYILARPETATDGDYDGIETVVAHEYFHNWTGNRITCRDWFQLSLKEGLTVFRDQQFSADQGSAAVRRIADVRRLRAGQFSEDAGPMAHPVRPDSYAAIDNFYTATVYQKGAEVVRMLHSTLGAEGFRRGVDEYVRRYDNQAVTIEDFVAALSAGGGVDLSPFVAWYSQAGTPSVAVRDAWEPGHNGGRYTLTLSQSTPPTPGQPDKRPLPIPVRLGLIGPDGAELAQDTVRLDHAEQEFVFEGLAARPVPSLLRGFSAPVRLTGLDDASLRHLAAHDTDPCVRWDSLQQYATHVLLRAVASGGTTLDAGLSEAFGAALARVDDDPAFCAEAMALPSEGTLADAMDLADPAAIYAVRTATRRALAVAHETSLRELHDRLADTGPYVFDGPSAGRRAARNACLAYLTAMGDVATAEARFAAASNMTDTLAALMALAVLGGEPAARALASFHAKWRSDPLVLDKWFSLQANARPDAIGTVRTLMAHPDFDLRNPNRFRALIGAFSGNPSAFHAEDGAGYDLLANAVIELDPVNGQVAARTVGALARWRRQQPARATKMRAALERVGAAPGVSRWTAEQVSRALA